MNFRQENVDATENNSFSAPRHLWVIGIALGHCCPRGYIIDAVPTRLLREAPGEVNEDRA